MEEMEGTHQRWLATRQKFYCDDDKQYNTRSTLDVTLRPNRNSIQGRAVNDDGERLQVSFRSRRPKSLSTTPGLIELLEVRE